MTQTIKHPRKYGFTLAGVSALALLASPAAHASAVIGDTFGILGQEFTIEFVDVRNSYNPNDTGPNGGPYGGVKYDYRMGKYEISQDMITRATASGLTGVTAGAWTGDKPAANVSWFQAAAFVNWLNTSKGYHAAYNLTGTNAMAPWSPAEAWVNDPGVGSEVNLFRHKSALYVLPSEDEWYKAAFHDPLKDGIGGYWDYATQSDVAPSPVFGGTAANTAVFKNSTGTVTPTGPAAVHDNGGLSSYGTRGQNGNVFEWSESAYDGENDYASESRTILGGGFNYTENYMRSKQRTPSNPTNKGNNVGFRVATVPEPSSALLLLGSVFPLLLARRRAAV